MVREHVRTYLGLGSNLGDRVKNLEEAVRLISTIPGSASLSVSGLYETAPEHFAPQPEFINCVLSLNSTLPAEELLGQVKKLEKQMGRKPSTRHGPRIIDIDILLHGNDIIRSKTLEVPHERLAERLFVLFPLAEIASELRHPVLGVSIGDLLEALRSRKRCRNG